MFHMGDSAVVSGALSKRTMGCDELKRFAHARRRLLWHTHVRACARTYTCAGRPPTWLWQQCYSVPAEPLCPIGPLYAANSVTHHWLSMHCPCPCALTAVLQCVYRSAVCLGVNLCLRKKWFS